MRNITVPADRSLVIGHKIVVRWEWVDETSIKVGFSLAGQRQQVHHHKGTTIYLTEGVFLHLWSVTPQAIRVGVDALPPLYLHKEENAC